MKSMIKCIILAERHISYDAFVNQMEERGFTLIAKEQGEFIFSLEEKNESNRDKI
jgi:hypothetical protein